MFIICKLPIFGHLICYECILTMFLLLKVSTQISVARSNGVDRSRKILELVLENEELDVELENVEEQQQY